MQVAKLVQSAERQSVELPPEFKFHWNEVFIRRDEATGEVILSPRRPDWESIFKELRDADIGEIWSPDDRNYMVANREDL